VQYALKRNLHTPGQIEKQALVAVLALALGRMLKTQLGILGVRAVLFNSYPASP